jgi:hypothetical protein
MGLRLSGLALFVTASALACSGSDDTVLALNMTSAPDVINVSEIDVTVTGSGSPLSLTFVPQIADAGPVPTFFQRITLPGWEGALHVHGEAKGPGLQGVSDDIDLVVDKGDAVVGYLKLHHPDAGQDGGDAAAGDAAGDAALPDAGLADAPVTDAPAPSTDSAVDGGAD